MKHLRLLFCCSWWSLYLLLLLLLQCSSSVAAESDDSAALLDFKGMITEDPSGALSSWNKTNHFCQWNGVVCDDDGATSPRVIALNLSSMGISGRVSPSVGNLTFLRELVLPENVLSGEIPPELGLLSQLELLDLSTNSLQGEIPIALINCTGLLELILIGNQLTGTIPPAIGSLSMLQVLYLANNSLTGVIPSAIANLTDLSMVALMGNHIVGTIPEGIGQLKLLEVLQVSSNNLSGDIPAQLFNLSSLWFLAAATNQLSGRLPQNMGLTLPNLQRLYLGANHLTGGIPSSLSNATGLTFISLDYNYLYGPVPSDFGRLQGLAELYLMGNALNNQGSWAFVDSLTNCSELQSLHLIANNFNGVLPESIARLSPGLQVLDLSYNFKISGEIPPGIKNLTNLSQLRFSGCKLTGVIPDEITELKMLQVLDLISNRITGQLPMQIGNMTSLTQIVLSWNYLEGPIPAGIGNLQRLMQLFLLSNNFNGTVPGEIFRPTSLQIINIGDNLLTGPIPPEIGNLKNLNFFEGSSNNFSGEIPHELGSCIILEFLNLQENSLSGEIPPSLNDLKGLIWTNISNNALSGTIGHVLENLPFLTSLDLSFNKLEGEVPTKGVYRNASIYLHGNKGLCGGIPALNLPPCPTPSFAEKQGLPPSKVLLIGSVVVAASFFCLFALAAFLMLLRVKKRRFAGGQIKPTDEGLEKHSLEICYPIISYAEIYRATQGFSGKNMVGAGAHGSVYIGEHKDSNATVAIKVFDLRTRGASKSYIAEQEALRTARHRNIVKILATCSDIDLEGNGFRALVYDFMPNGSLEEWLHAGEEDGRSLDLFTRLSIASDVADALHYLHNGCRPPIAHCDVKPSNVLLNTEMTARLTDFGISRFVHEHPESNTIGIRGSVGYIAPEFGSGGRASTYSDVYSYGIVLLEMFTGRRPVDNMFRDGLDLHKYVEMALPDRVIEIVDPRILAKESNDDVHECLVSVLQVGLS